MLAFPNLPLKYWQEGFSLKTAQKSFLLVFLAILIPACSTPTALTPPTIEVTTSPAVVTFVDPMLEAMIRGAMGKPEGGITVAEAEAVTRLNLNNEMQRYISGETPIKDISGLENFTNLESLDLSLHEITNISPLAGLTKLTSLSLEGNPVADISPLAKLTNLKVLILSNCAAQDYRPLANLVNLEFLKLDNSTLTDINPLASLTGLKYLYLANNRIIDYSPLTNIYPNLEEKDFIIPSTLEELGFYMNDEHNMAKFENEHLDVIINHSEWGAPAIEGVTNCVRLTMPLENGYILKGAYCPDRKVYGFGIVKDNANPIIYSYDTTHSEFMYESGDRESSEQAVRAAMEVVEGEDVLLSPIRLYNDTIQNLFHMTANGLYALPFEPPTLKNLGFFPDRANAVCLYEQRGEGDYNIEIHRPEWGKKDYDIRFFTPLSDEYRIVITYNFDERKYLVSVDDNYGGGASFEFFSDTNEHNDIWCSDKEMTVQDYFIKAYNDPAISDVYVHSVELFEQYFSNRFDMTAEKMFSLPSCD
jgi:hypothetical protein